MKEAAFGHPRFVADVIQRRGRVARGPDDMQGRIQKADPLILAPTVRSPTLMAARARF
jgi:hypothetical protein